MDELQAVGVPVHTVGKIGQVFDGVGVDVQHKGATNAAALEATAQLIDSLDGGFVFTNLVETDQVYGHRGDVPGFHNALKGIDAEVGRWLERLDPARDLLILTAVACWTIYTIGTRRLGKRLSALRFTTLTMITGTPGLLLLGLPDLIRMPWGSISGQAWAGLGYSLMLSLVASYVLWNRGVQILGASRAALYNCLTPLIAATLATIILHEEPTLTHVIGGSLILGGVVLGMAGRRGGG